MAKQLLIYERAVPLSSVRHRSLYVKMGSDYRFSRDVSAVPVLEPEFAQAAMCYVLVFIGEGDEVMPAALLGIRAGQNAFLREDGGWDAAYIPAFVRQYPFVVSRREGDDDSFTLCIDDSYAGCNEEGRGERLFDADGERTAFLRQMVAWTGEYQGQFHRTKRFSAKLRNLGLLVPMEARVRVRSGEDVALSGFMAVDRNRLAELTGDQLADLMREGELELVYQHLMSLRNIESLAARDPETPASDGQGTPDSEIAKDTGASDAANQAGASGSDAGMAQDR